MTFASQKRGEVNGTQLSASPSIWLANDLLADSHVDGVLKLLPKDESEWTPCIGQVSEFASKRCTTLAVETEGVLPSLLLLLSQ